MNRIALLFAVGVLVSQGVFGQNEGDWKEGQPEHQSSLGASLALQLIDFEIGSQLLTYGMGIGFSGFPTEGFGVVGLSSMTLPFQISVDGTNLYSKGIVTDVSVGLGNTFAIQFASGFGQGVGMLMLGGGIHMNITNIYDSTGQISLFSFGPAILVGAGNSLTRFRTASEIHLDLVNIPISASAFGAEYEVFPVRNFGTTVTLGFLL